MGVKDLWKILECSGHPVTLESLEGLILAIGELLPVRLAQPSTHHLSCSTCDNKKLIITNNAKAYLE